MPRLAYVAAALALAAGPAFAAQMNTFTVKLETPMERPNPRLVAASVVWNCAGDTCVGQLARRTPIVRDCRMVAREVGRIRSFATGEAQLSADDLARCNEGAKA